VAPITAAFSGFVPKAGTPWQDCEAVPSSEFRRRFHLIRDALKRDSGTVKVLAESPNQIARQAYLAKAGPELGEELEKEAEKWKERGAFAGKGDTSWDF
jgi:precorrin-6B methylase 1